MVCVWRLVLATFACVGKSEGFCCWWSATGDPCDCSETSKASNLATSLACVDGGGSWCSEDGEQSAPEDGEQSAAVRRGRAVRARPGPRPEVPVGRFPAGAPPRTMAAPAYSKEEVSALRGIFALYDPDGTGEIGSNDLENLFKKIGFFNYAAVELIKQFDVEEPKTIDFAKFLEMVEAGQPDQPGEEPDPKVLDGGEQFAPEDGSSSCACRSIMAGITDKWCQLSDCDPAFAAQCSSACPTALARAARTQAKSPAAPRARKVPRRVAARAAAAAAAPPPPQRKLASAEKPPKKAPPFSSSTPDGCERNWLFQVSTGRSGSTSLMTMLNDLPNVYIAGENDGLFESLYALHKSSILTDSMAKGKKDHDAWWHHPVERSKLQRIARTYVESAIGLKQNQNYAWVGFKEIRFRTDDELDYILSLFPCSKVIVNIRRDVVRQHKSAFKRSSPISKLKSQNDMLLKWSKKHPKRVFRLALEDFNLDNFNRLAVWLDFPNCHFKQIAHANRNGGYGADNRHFVTC